MGERVELSGCFGLTRIDYRVRRATLRRRDSTSVFLMRITFIAEASSSALTETSSSLEDGRANAPSGRETSEQGPWSRHSPTLPRE